MERYQIVIAGNGEPALVCTLSARNTYTDKSIAIIKTDKKNTIIEEILTPITGTFNNMFNIFYDDIASREIETTCTFSTRTKHHPSSR